MRRPLPIEGDVQGSLDPRSSSKATSGGLKHGPGIDRRTGMAPQSPGSRILIVKFGIEGFSGPFAYERSHEQRQK